MTTVPSRRAVLKTSAWSVPAVVLTGAAPAFAGSGQEAGVRLDPACSPEYVNPMVRITALGPAPVPAGTIVSSSGAGPNLYTWLQGQSWTYYPGVTSTALHFEIPVGSYADILFEYLPNTYPNPSVALTLPSGYTATADSVLSGGTTGNACSTPALRSAAVSVVEGGVASELSAR